jgi:hypothetical protein
MQRRDFIKSAAVAGTIAAIGRRAHAAAKGWREFESPIQVNGELGPGSDFADRRA